METFGRPIYYQKNSDVFNGAWEKGNTTYLFILDYNSSINGVETRISNLYIIDNSNDAITDRFYSAEFQYYGDFVHERKKRNDPNLTYLQFAKYEAEENLTEYYLDKINTNEPLED